MAYRIHASLVKSDVTFTSIFHTIFPILHVVKISNNNFKLSLIAIFLLFLLSYEIPCNGTVDYAIAILT